MHDPFADDGLPGGDAPREVWIIEAPGKSRALTALLGRMGRRADVYSTKGHLFSFPEGLEPLGIDADGHDHGRTIRDPDRVVAIRKAAARASRVYVATDADQEGDVIAWDVATVISDIVPDPVRVRLRGIDEDAVRDALDAPGDVRPEDAVPGRTRAIVDRVIGATFSRPGLPVGRVGSAVIGLAAGGIDRDRATIVAPAVGGGRPFVCSFDFGSTVSRATVERLVGREWPALVPGSTGPSTYAPGDTSRMISRAGDDLDMPPTQTMKGLQTLYEEGRFSYPRSDGKGLSPASARALARALRDVGIKAREEALATKADTDTHDAPHPVGPVRCRGSVEALGDVEGLREVAARDLARASVVRSADRADDGPVRREMERMGLTAAQINHVLAEGFVREMGPRVPDEDAYPSSGVRGRRADVVLVERMTAAGVGRPSTWAHHAEKSLARGLVDADLRPTARGRRCLEAAPPSLRTPELCARVEGVIADLPRHGTDASPAWERNAMAILSRVPDDVRAPVAERLAREPSVPRRDPVDRSAPDGPRRPDVVADVPAPAPSRAARPRPF